MRIPQHWSEVLASNSADWMVWLIETGSQAAPEGWDNFISSPITACARHPASRIASADSLSWLFWPRRRQQLCVGDDGGQRVADLVRYARCQLADGRHARCLREERQLLFLRKCRLVVCDAQGSNLPPRLILVVERCNLQNDPDRLAAGRKVLAQLACFLLWRFLCFNARRG
jgi:hypothetical protein